MAPAPDTKNSMPWALEDSEGKGRGGEGWLTVNARRCGHGHRDRGSRCIGSGGATDSQSTLTCRRAPHERRSGSDRQPEAK
jgi:hypothetical protein